MQNSQATCCKASGGRTGSLLVIFGAALLVPALLMSRSSVGAVLGRYSPGLTAAVIACLFAATASLGLLLGLGIPGRILRAAGRVPESLVVYTAVFPLPAFVLFWFLVPIPLFDRWNAFLGACLLAAAPGALLLGAREKPARDAAKKGVIVVAITFLVCLALAEVAMRAVVPGSFFNPRLGLIPHARYEIMTGIEGVSNGGTMSTNRWGLRGEEPPVEWDRYTTVVTVGGSTTADYYIDDSRTWSNILQEELREADPLVWVGNGGIPRASTQHHEFFLREVIARIRPDIVVFLVGVNDMGQFMKGVAAVDRFVLAEGSIREWLFSNSRLLQVLYKIKRVYVDNAPVVMRSDEPLFVREPLSSPEQPLPDDPGEMLPNPGHYSRQIRTLIESCREMGVRPVFLTQPLLFDDNEYWRGIRGGSYWHGDDDSPFSAASFWIMLDYLNKQLIDVCSSEGVACFDLASAVPHDSLYFYDSMHFSEAGSKLVGELTAEFMLDRGMLQAE